MNRARPASGYRGFGGSVRARRWTAWWPITRSELASRFLKWRYLPVALIVLAPLLFREAILYARFVVAPVRVNLMNQMSSVGGPMARLMRWDAFDFYADYLEDGFLWTFLLLVAAILGVPSVARDLRSRAWEVYFSRGIDRGTYFLGKFVAIFTVLFAMTGGGVLCLYLTTSMLGPEEGFFTAHLSWLPPLLLQAVVLSATLTLFALAFGTISPNGLVLAIAWLGLFFGAVAAERVMSVVRRDAAFAWLDPRQLLVRVGRTIQDRAPEVPVAAWLAWTVLGALVAISAITLFRFLRQREREVA